MCTIRNLLVLLAALCVSISATFAAEVSLRTMTFNVRYAGTVDDLFGNNGWYNLANPADSRAEKAIQIVRDYNPDILGTQELLDFQLYGMSGELLASGLSDYDYYAVGREDGVHAGEHAAIFWRADRFTQLDAGTFWLTPTPEVPGSIYPGAGTTRIASWVVLEDHLSGQELFVLDTHWDNVSGAANLYSANLIRERLPELADGRPILLTGDLNSTQSSSAVQTLLGLNDPSGIQLGDAFREVNAPSSNELTFHNYGGGTVGSRIDFILHTDELTPTAASIVRTSYDGKYPSDHYPVTAEFTLAVVPEPGSLVLLLSGAVLLLVVRRRICASSLCKRGQNPEGHASRVTAHC
jgi:endonuclease/exonuclease/phosphatase family metal-dependent hydrolase